jgi:SAM-dependent methyltransferase
MTLSHSWQFIGSTGSVWYRLYDRLRRGVNAHLVTFLGGHLHSSEKRSAGSQPAKRLRVLEAGSGTAFASSLMAGRSEVSSSVCMDVDIEALRQAKNRHPDLAAVVGDLRSMPFADESFALVFNNSTVEHLDEPVRAVREMRRACEDSGRVFVGVPYAWGPLGFQPVVGRTRVGVWLGRVFTRSSLDRMLQSAGLTPVAHLRYFWRFFIGAVAAKPRSHGHRNASEAPPC